MHICMTGKGIEMSDSGVFSGYFTNDRRDGYGRLDHADGTTIHGTYQKVEQFTSHSPSPVYTDGVTQNPYLDGVCHGEVDILYGDGARYKGAMTNGRITGVFIYIYYNTIIYTYSPYI